MKTCKTCLKDLDTSEFWNHSRSKDRLHYSCKPCMKIANQIYKQSKTDASSKLKPLFRSAKHRAKIRKIDFTISYEDLLECWKKQDGKCYYTNVPLTFNIPWGRSEVSIDRVDPSAGYVAGNIVLSSFIMNSVKTSLTINELSILTSLFLERFPPQNNEFNWTATIKLRNLQS